jgi:hypothetical protein
VVASDPIGWFGHSKLRVAAGHALDAHQPHLLPVEVESAVADLDLANSESGIERVAAGEFGAKLVKVGMVEVPEPRLVERGRPQRHSLRFTGSQPNRRSFRTSERRVPGCLVDHPVANRPFP